MNNNYYGYWNQQAMPSDYGNNYYGYDYDQNIDQGYYNQFNYNEAQSCAQVTQTPVIEHGSTLRALLTRPRVEKKVLANKSVDLTSDLTSFCTNVTTAEKSFGIQSSPVLQTPESPESIVNNDEEMGFGGYKNDSKGSPSSVVSDNAVEANIYPWMKQSNGKLLCVPCTYDTVIGLVAN